MLTEVNTHSPVKMLGKLSKLEVTVTHLPLYCLKKLDPMTHVENRLETKYHSSLLAILNCLGAMSVCLQKKVSIIDR